MCSSQTTIQTSKFYPRANTPAWHHHNSAALVCLIQEQGQHAYVSAHQSHTVA